MLLSLSFRRYSSATAAPNVALDRGKKHRAAHNPLLKEGSSRRYRRDGGGPPRVSSLIRFERGFDMLSGLIVRKYSDDGLTTPAAPLPARPTLCEALSLCPSLIVAQFSTILDPPQSEGIAP